MPCAPLLQDEEGRTPLHFAADRGHAAAASRLLELGARIDAQDSDGMTPLAYAVACENEKAIEVLVSNMTCAVSIVSPS